MMLLDAKSCDEAFEKAKAFFKSETGEVCAFVCGLWLLYPENKDILPKHSNIYRFMLRFDVIKTRIDKEQNGLWRLFDTDEKNADKLPADSSVRRAYVEQLKKGGKQARDLACFSCKA